MKCQFDSSPAAHLQWFKIFGEHNEMILDEDYPRVIQIVNHQISSTIYETQLTVDRFSFHNMILRQLTLMILV